MLDHGGRLIAAAHEYGIPLGDWLDLSTGVNPQGWPIPPIPRLLWSHLPEEGDGLEEAACAYYGAARVLPMAGTQPAIQALPRLRAPGRVGIPQPAYAEHAQAWDRAGHEVVPWSPEQGVDDLNALVLINPNNPTGTRYRPGQLLDWHQLLAKRSGWLVVDEAFLDVEPEDSLAPYSAQPGLVVLRGMGKFFGLPGARVGFALAEDRLLDNLHEALGPWTVPSPSRWLARGALLDLHWQIAERKRLRGAGLRLADLLIRHGLRPTGGTALFQWLATPYALEIHRRLARLGILSRLFDAPSSLRFGLPGDEAGWARLEAALP